MENIYLLEQSVARALTIVFGNLWMSETTVANIFGFETAFYTAVDESVLPRVVRALLLRFAASMDIS